MNKSGELGSPCFRPICDVKKIECDDLNLIHDFTTLHIELIARTNLLLTCSRFNLCHKSDLLIRSNAFS